MPLWIKDGSLVVDDAGGLVDCEDCPCPEGDCECCEEPTVLAVSISGVLACACVNGTWEVGCSGIRTYDVDDEDCLFRITFETLLECGLGVQFAQVTIKVYDLDTLDLIAELIWSRSIAFNDDPIDCSQTYELFSFDEGGEDCDWSAATVELGPA